MGHRYKHSKLNIFIMVFASMMIHGVLFAAISKEARDPAPKKEIVEFEFTRSEPPPPPPPEKQETPEPEKKPEPARKIARIIPKRAAPKTPPPPNTEMADPPKEAQEPPVVKIGISMGSTTTGGGFAVGVGNSLYGKADKVASDPKDVKPYSSKAPYVPPTRVSSLPRLVHQTKPPYPVEARKAGIEGQVILMLAIDETGRVTSAKVVSGLGYGLDKVAEETALKFKFSPALVEGEPVATEIRYVYTFVLE